MDYLKIYNYVYDYEDIKLAIIISNFIRENDSETFYNYEDIANLVIKIRRAWDDTPLEEMTEEENAYIQIFAQHYLEKEYNKIKGE